MKIFSAVQIRKWDAWTIENEPVTSIELMNRAARAFTDWFVNRYPDTTRPILVLAGTGNNGGDGLAIARMLDMAQYRAKVVVCDFGTRHSADFDAQWKMLSGFALEKHVCTSMAEFSQQADAFPGDNAVLVDALFGSGLNRAPEGEWLALIRWINASGREVVSVDVPSGLFCDRHSAPDSVVRASRVFSFEIPKRAFFFPENESFTGDWACDAIGLHPVYEQQEPTDFYYFTHREAGQIREKRTKFSHKGTYGHALMIAGSWGKMGAAVLAARACLRSGAGLLTVHAPRCGNTVLQSAAPEAMYSADLQARYWSSLPDLTPFSAIGVGPGIGKEPATARVLLQLLQAARMPVVLDADALNLISEHPVFLDFIPENSILTPHPKEFERLFGKSDNDFDRNDRQREMAVKYKVVIVLKGAHTATALPDGSCWFNSTGNPGMAKGGSGDVLTGLITGLLARGYTPGNAAVYGVFLHGLAGDRAAAHYGQEAMKAGDVVDCLGEAEEC